MGVSPVSERPKGSPWVVKGLEIGGLLAFFGIGYWVYVQVAGSLLQEARTLPVGWLLGLALVGGTASFFSPCGIALTPAFLGYLMEPTDRSSDTTDVLDGRVLMQGSLWLAAGILSFYVAVGLLVGWIGALLYRDLIYINLVVGVSFLGLGALILQGRGLSMPTWGRNPAARAWDPVAVRRHPRPGRLYRLGWAYGAASQTCTGPIFLGIVLMPLTVGAYWLAATTTILYGMAIAGLLVITVLLGRTTLAGLGRGRLGHFFLRATGVMFVLTGAVLLLYVAQNLARV